MQVNHGAAWDVVASLQSSLRDGEHGLSAVPGLLARVIQEGLWKEFFCEPLQKVVSFGSFSEYVAKELPEGLGTDERTLTNLCKDNAIALKCLRKAMHQHGGDRKSVNNCDNITFDPVKTGTSKAYTLSRLERESPELFQAVCDGELSANAAAIKAGFRKPPPSNEEKCLSAFKRSERRCELLRAIVLNLEPHEWEFAKEVRADA